MINPINHHNEKAKVHFLTAAPPQKYIDGIYCYAKTGKISTVKVDEKEPC